MPPKAKSPKPEDLKPILQPFQVDMLISKLRDYSPSKILLPEGATMEQRAMHQCRIQEYEKLLGILTQLSNGLKVEKLEATYS